MEIDTIRRMAKRGTLEVEHLLRLAKSPSPGLASDLEELALELEWRSGNQSPFVPYGDWVVVLAEFCRNSYGGLTSLAANPHYLNFVVGLLEELSSIEAFDALESILAEHRAVIATDELKSKLAGAFNRVGMALVNKSSYPEAEKVEAVRKFLNDQVASHPDEAGRGTAMCALRYFGGSDSLDIVRSAPPMTENWESARTAAIRAIRKRLREQTQVS
jgi:hypothetical protein